MAGTLREVKIKGSNDVEHVNMRYKSLQPASTTFVYFKLQAAA
jgi:hypothetical protein